MQGFDPLKPPHLLSFPYRRGIAKSVRHGTLTPACVGSSPAAPAKNDSLAQSVEHLTFNQVVGGSNPPCLTLEKASNSVFTRVWSFFNFSEKSSVTESVTVKAINLVKLQIN